MKNRLKESFKQHLSFFFSVPALLWQVLFLCVPLLIIVCYSCVDKSGQFLTLVNYKSILHVPFLYILLRSLFLATATATITLLCAYPVVYYLVFHVRPLSRYFITCMMLPFGVNFLMLTYSWFFLLERNGLINTVLSGIGFINTPIQFLYSQGAVLLVMVYCYIPFMIIPLYMSLEKLDQRLIDASADLGANAWQTFMRVTLPLSLPGIKTGFLLVFVPAFGEFAIPTLLGGSKFLVIGSLISYYFFVARNNSFGAACTVASALCLLLVVLLIQNCTRIYVFIKKKAES